MANDEDALFGYPIRANVAMHPVVWRLAHEEGWLAAMAVMGGDLTVREWAMLMGLSDGEVVQMARAINVILRGQDNLDCGGST